MKAINEVITEKIERPVKVLQFGEGNFLRAFVDYMIDIMNEETDFNGSIVLVKPIEFGTIEQFEKQNNLYTVYLRGLENGKETIKKRVVTSVDKTVAAYENYDEYAAYAKLESLRFIVSNTTEAGIVLNLDDKLEMNPPSSYPAKLTKFLYERYTHFNGDKSKGLVMLPVELIDNNGKELEKCVKALSESWKLESGFTQWLDEACVFASTLVDRIVTGYPRDEKIDLGYEDNMVNTSELFHLWVIEGPSSITKEFPFDKAGLNIIVTDNLERYRTRKVRILNGAHTSMIPYAMLLGVETVGDCMEHEVLSRFVSDCVYKEIIPTLDLPEEELIDYANNVFERFKNPYIKHLCASISLNSVSKFKVRVLPSILEYIKRKNAMPQNLLTSFAKLIAFYKTDMPNDDEKVMKFMKEASVEEILANKELWDEDLSFLADEIKGRL